MNCIILHGCPGNIEKAINPLTRTYDKHWMQWAKKELESKGITTKIPIMPKPWNANYSKWKAEFDKNKVNKDTILIGHSCGCAFLVRWLGDTKKKIKKLILVAPWKIAETGNAEKEFYDYNIDSDIKTRVKEIIIFTADNEEKDGKKSVDIFNKVLNGRVIELKGKGHYTLDEMGTEEFPELIEEAIKWKKK